MIGWLCLLLALAAVNGYADTELDLRLKYFATGQALPNADLNRQLGGTPQYDHNGDVRTLIRHYNGSFSFALDHTLAFSAGDAFSALGFATGTADVGQLVDNDDRRPLDMTWQLQEGDRHQLWHRLDRLFVNWQTGNWSATVGRQAISWGGGLVFAPLDLFSPFTPTAVDKDYKPGEDALLLERLFADGSDLQLLAVGRRDEAEEFTGQAASVGGKYRRALGNGELELVLGKHYRDQIVGLGWRYPVGGALLRTDLLFTDSEDFGSVRVSGLLNLDYSVAWRERTIYLFAEYFHNGFGVRSLPDSLLDLPTELIDRLGRGEVFTLMRDYLALGTQIQWHPLWIQSQTLIANLQDGSALLQAQLTYEPSDKTRLEFGFVATLGTRDKEFGGVPVFMLPANQGPGSGRTLYQGGTDQLYLRWAYYF